MNINKIRGLSEQHQALKHFHETCNRPGAELTVSTTTTAGVSLGTSGTKSIICELQHILHKKIGEIEQEIKAEAMI